MRIPRTARALGHIADELITSADGYSRKITSRLLIFGPVAACLAVLVAAGAALFWKGGTTGGRYREGYTVMSGETAIVWPWEYLTMSEKYPNVEIDSVRYLSTGRPVSEELVGESIGNCDVTGYDEADGRKEYTAEFEAYTLRDIAQSQFVAVKMEDKFYVFKNGEYAPPATLGELFAQVYLPEFIELRRFSENGDGPDNRHFELDDDSYIWEVLSGCGDAPFVEDQDWAFTERSYLSFTVTSEALGVYKSALYVTEDGWLWTNAFDWQYLFDIGEDAAGSIIRWAKENARDAEFETYMNWVAGTVTEITDEYILIDDSILCKDPADGLVYRVPLDDPRISRYIAYGIVGAGDTVRVSYTGEIDGERGNAIEGVASLERVEIQNGDVMAAE